MASPVKRRRNGFELPFHPLQIVGWVVALADVSIYFLFCLPLISDPGAQVAMAFLFAASFLVLLIACILVTAADCADPGLDDAAIASSTASAKCKNWCSPCSIKKHSRSKHCWQCHKCISVFDHHCMWLNNCIGEANYKAFLVTISAVGAMTAIIVGTVAYFAVCYISDTDALIARLDDIDFLKGASFELLYVLFGLLILVNGPLFLLDMQLVFLHIYFISQNITTYEYIMIQVKKQADTRDTQPSECLKPFLRCAAWMVLRRCKCGRRKANKIAPLESKVPAAEAPKPLKLSESSSKLDELATEAPSSSTPSSDLRAASACASEIDSPGQLTVQEEPANLQQDAAAQLVKVTVGAPCEPYAKIEIDAIGVPEDFAREGSYDVEAQQEEPKRRVLQEDSRVKAVALGAPCKPAPLGAHEGEKHSDADSYGNSTPADLLYAAVTSDACPPPAVEAIRPSRRQADVGGDVEEAFIEKNEKVEQTDR